MQLQLNTEELNTLILYLAYTLGHLELKDGQEIMDLNQSAEILRRRLERKLTRSLAASAG